MRKFTDEDRDRIRAELIGTAQELLMEYGPTKTTVKDITDPVGIAKPTFYQFLTRNPNCTSSFSNRNLMNSWIVSKQNLMVLIILAPGWSDFSDVIWNSGRETNSSNRSSYKETIVIS